MLIIAISGAVGAGKTSLLHKLSLWYQHQKIYVDGFLAPAIERSNNNGAPQYNLHFIATAKELPFAIRNENTHPPYMFNEEAEAETIRWAEKLCEKKNLPLIILDEFGPIEAHGGGHLRLWSKITAAKPEVVALSIREGFQQKIEEHLNAKFDVIINASDTEAWQKLRTACIDHRDWSRIGTYGAASGGIEISLGSALHGTQFPMRGMILASLQSALMMYSADGLGKHGRVVWVPFISAGLKALSPAGNRLRPMLAIVIQGFLFGTAIEFFGWNIFSIITASSLVGAWAAFQGIALQYLFIGNDLLKAYDTILHWISKFFHIASPNIFLIIALWVILHAFISSAITVSFWRRRQTIPARLQTIIERGSGIITFSEIQPTVRTALLRGIKDVMRPYFFLPITIVVTTLLLSGSSLESVGWIVLRAISIGFIIFSLVQFFQPKKVALWLHKKGKWGPAFAFRKAFSSSEKKV